jgi:hypothetical protein
MLGVVSTQKRKRSVSCIYQLTNKRRKTSEIWLITELVLHILSFLHIHEMIRVIQSEKRVYNAFMKSRVIRDILDYRFRHVLFVGALRVLSIDVHTHKRHEFIWSGPFEEKKDISTMRFINLYRYNIFSNLNDWKIQFLQYIARKMIPNAIHTSGIYQPKFYNRMIDFTYGIGCNHTKLNFEVTEEYICIKIVGIMKWGKTYKIKCEPTITNFDDKTNQLLFGTHHSNGECIDHSKYYHLIDPSPHRGTRKGGIATSKRCVFQLIPIKYQE